MPSILLGIPVQFLIRSAGSAARAHLITSILQGSKLRLGRFAGLFKLTQLTQRFQLGHLTPKACTFCPESLGCVSHLGIGAVGIQATCTGKLAVTKGSAGPGRASLGRPPQALVWQGRLPWQ